MFQAFFLELFFCLNQSKVQIFDFVNRRNRVASATGLHVARRRWRAKAAFIFVATSYYDRVVRALNALYLNISARFDLFEDFKKGRTKLFVDLG